MAFDVRGFKKKQCMGQLQEFIDGLIGTIGRLEERLNSYNKDDEIKRLQDANAQLRSNSLYILSDKEEQKAKAFRKEHWETCKGNVFYVITPTGIGTGVDVVCSKCKTEQNITDYTDW